MGKIRINKAEAARRQIETAIILLFDNKDTVSIHTLAAAGCRIVRDLCKARNTPLHKEVQAIFKPGMEREALAAMNRPANFFKHADNDADAILDNVDEEVNDALLFMACRYYLDLGYAPTAPIQALMNWMLFRKPNYMKPEHPYAAIADHESFKWLRNLPRHEQLQAGKQMLEQCRQLQTQG